MNSPGKFLIAGLMLVVLGCEGGTSAPSVAPLVSQVEVPATVPVDVPTQINSSVDGNVTGWDWFFAEGTTPRTASVARPVITCRTLGRFEGTLIVSNSAGPSQPFAFTYIVAAPGVPTAPPMIMSVVPDDPVAVEGDPVRFQAFTDVPATAMEWEFGGGAMPGTSSLLEPEVILREAGHYLGRVRATGAYGPGEWKHFELRVGQQSSGGLPPSLGEIVAGGEMGDPGEQVFFRVIAFNQVYSYEWDLGRGALPRRSQESHPYVTLGEAGIYAGTVTVKNRRGSIVLPFTYSVGGAAATLMAQRWGGSWTQGSSRLAVLSDGRIAGLPVSPFHLPIGTPHADLDPGWTTLYSGQEGSGSSTFPRSSVVIARMDGTVEQVLRWNEVYLSLEHLVAGADGELIVIAALGRLQPGQTSVDLDPGPGELRVPLRSEDQTAILGVRPDGQVRLIHLEQRASLSSTPVAAGPDGSIYFTAYIYGSWGVICVDPSGAVRWRYPLWSIPSVVRGTPDGGAMIAGAFDDDFLFGPGHYAYPKGRSDGYVIRVAGDGSYQWHASWGGEYSVAAMSSAEVFDPTDVLVRSDGSCIVAGQSRRALVDFDPGPDVVYGVSEACSSSIYERDDRGYALHLSAGGLFEGVHVWSVNADDPNLLLQDLGDQGWLMLFRPDWCVEAVARDLDPGPGQWPAPFRTSTALVHIGPDGNLVRAATWDGSVIPRFLIPGDGGGSFVGLSGTTSDLDPGAGFFDPAAVATTPADYHLFLTPEFEWGVPH